MAIVIDTSTLKKKLKPCLPSPASLQIKCSALNRLVTKPEQGASRRNLPARAVGCRWCNVSANEAVLYRCHISFQRMQTLRVADTDPAACRAPLLASQSSPLSFVCKVLTTWDHWPTFWENVPRAVIRICSVSGALVCLTALSSADKLLPGLES